MSTADRDALLEITRMLDAPPAQVFSAWLDREEWQSWIGPEGVNCEVPLMEPHVGGRYRLVMHLPDGQTMRVAGAFKIIDAPRVLVFTWGPDGGPYDSVVTIRLRPVGDGTELTLRHEGLLTIENRDGHGKGWNSALNKLERYLAAKGSV